MTVVHDYSTISYVTNCVECAKRHECFTVSFLSPSDSYQRFPHHSEKLISVLQQPGVFEFIKSVHAFVGYLVWQWTMSGGICLLQQ